MDDMNPATRDVLIRHMEQASEQATRCRERAKELRGWLAKAERSAATYENEAAQIKADLERSAHRLTVDSTVAEFLRG